MFSFVNDRYVKQSLFEPWTADISDFLKSGENKISIEIVNKLPEQYRIAVLMRDVDGLDYEDIAEKLQVNVNTLRVNLSRGRKMVREQLMKLNYEPARS